MNKVKGDQTSVRKNERQGYGSRQGMKGTAGKLIKGGGNGGRRKRRKRDERRGERRAKARGKFRDGGKGADTRRAGTRALQRTTELRKKGRLSCSDAFKEELESDKRDAVR